MPVYIINVMELKSQIKVFLAVYFVIAALCIVFLDNVMTFDDQVASFMLNYSNPALDLFFNIITYGGTIAFWVVIIFLVWITGDKKTTSLLMLGLIIELILTGILKLSFGRYRPTEENITYILNIPDSFPSAHSTRAFLGAMLMKNYQLIFVILAVLVATSRIYLGVHYPSDVLFGALNGIGIALFLRLIPAKRLKIFYTKK